MADDTYWMREAISLAQHAAVKQEVPVGAVIVYQDELIGSGWNQPINQNDPSAHAEVIALRDAAKTRKNYRLLNTTMYVTLEPCIMCVGALLHARVQRLVFGANDPKTGAVGSVFDLLSDTRHNHSIEVTRGVLEQDCSNLLKVFFQQRR